MKAIFVFLFFVPSVAYAAALPPKPLELGIFDWPLAILNKLLADFKHMVDAIVAQVNKIKQEVEKDIKKLDPAIIKDLENIVDSIVGLSNAGMEIASGVLALCQKIPHVPEAVFDFIKAGFAIFQDVSHIILDVIDILQHINKEQGATSQTIEMQKKLEQTAASFNNAMNQLKAQLDKHHG